MKNQELNYDLSNEIASSNNFFHIRGDKKIMSIGGEMQPTMKNYGFLRSQISITK